ncbi:MAG: di-heme oxidoredictase family protein [Candidatus Kaistia colombiensis]|nr:MAG: di-heme oxidoredictase family protein [Kaistia sp.]
MRLRHALLALALFTALPAIALADGLDAAIGKALFDRIWVEAPSSTAANDGLGPLFNEKSCASCHSGKALSAKITPLEDGTVAQRGLATRLGDRHGATDPVYGRQIQPRAVSGLISEGTVTYALPEKPGDALAVIFAPSRGDLAPDTRLGPRQAPSLRGIGLIDKVDEAAVLERAARNKNHPDGVGGRPRLLAVDGEPKLGRYGWKASAATLDQMTSDAFMLDIGMSSPLAPFPYGDCTKMEPDCLAAPNGRSPGFDNEEISAEMVRLLNAYLKSLAAPAPVEPAPPGAALFASTGCAACHVPSLPARDGGTVAIYSDLLLHDMGPGLDDGVGEPGVASSEWRTAPLTSLAFRTDADRRFLHDGRAGTLDEAIRAHGGEATAAKTRYEALLAADRAALVAYLETL